MVNYTLSNAEELNRDNMLRFDIPSRDERTSLKHGDTVKLIFDETERMWVNVIGQNSDGYVGLLANIPSKIKTIEWGDDVVFGPEHIIAIADDDIPRAVKGRDDEIEDAENLVMVPKGENTNKPPLTH